LAASKIDMAKKETEVEIAGKHLRLSNLDKVMYPEVGFTKGQVIDYYARIAPVLLPHLHGRPLTLKRYPNGVTGMHFYEKNCPEHRPEWVQVAPIWSPGNNKWVNYCLAQDLPTLIWAANLADIELHTSLSQSKDMIRPTFIVFDLDPGAPANIVQCCHVGLWVRKTFEKFGLKSFAKTSGSKGLQIYVPLNTAVTYDQTKPFAHELARLMECRHPELIVSDMKKSLRTGKILVDWSQNDDYKTTVCVYSLRAKDRPTVSTPVQWTEVEQCLKEQNPELLTFTSDQVLARVDKHGDLFEPVLTMRQKLPPAEALVELSTPTSETVRATAQSKKSRTPATKERAKVMAMKKSSGRIKAS
jgi:bifunctional non-homologous end joining protein LigD